MENKDYNPDIINYLYGEMSDEEKKAFEEKMANNPALKAEVDALQGVRSTMGELEDQEPRSQNIGFEATPSRRNSETAHWITPLLAIAASIALLLLTGYYTNFSIQQNEQGLFIGFSKATSDQYVEKSEVENMIQDALTMQQKAFDQQLTANQDSIQKYLASLEPKNEKANNPGDQLRSNMVSESELTRQMNKLQSGQTAMLQKYIEAVNEQQQDYLQEALLQFSDYLQEQREEDLLTIQRNLNDLKAYQDQHKQVTNQLLADIIATVNEEK